MRADAGREDVLRMLEALDKVDVGVWKPSSSVPEDTDYENKFAFDEN